jgi:hypothetical protein
MQAGQSFEAQQLPNDLLDAAIFAEHGPCCNR